MSEPAAKRKVSPREFLDICERTWRKRIDLASLAAEVLDDIAVHHRERSLKVLGRLYADVGPGMAGELMLRRWPSVHVLATAGVAAEHYERATFWPKLLGLIDIDPDPSFQPAWGKAFLDNLRRLGLPTFDKNEDAGSRYVGRILLHAGIPTYCLGDFFRIISWKRSTTPGLTPEEFISWASAKVSSGSGFKNVDVPVQRFVRFGDEFAVDVADRTFDLLDAVTAGLSAGDVLLPQRFWDVAEQLHQQRAIDYVSMPGRVRQDNSDLRPRLVLDPFGQGLILRLPPVGDAPDGRAVWIVVLDEDTQRVATESLWPGSTEPAPQTDVALGRPVRSASVALARSEHLQLSLSVVDDEDPLLVFGEDCELIPRGLPLPAARVWLLFPGDLESLRIAGSFQIVAESPLPPRWSGFCLVQADMSDAVSVSLGGSTRTVRKFDAARIDAAAPVRGVRTTSGLPVLAELPRITVPANMSKAEWDVTLHDTAGEVIARHRVASDEGPNQLWEKVPRPLVGDYTIRVRGPWGRGATRSFTVVEGLAVACTPGWRRFVPGGLLPCVANVRVADGVELSRSQLDFDARKREQVIRAGAQSQYRSLAIVPPHMTVAYQSARLTMSPSVRPLSLVREDMQDTPGELLLDIGASAEPALHLIANNVVVQSLAARGGRAGVYRFDFAEIVDTLRDCPQVTLALSEDGALVVANVRPRTLFTGIELDGDELVLLDCVAVEGLSAYLFATRAPWREPACVPVVDGRVALPPWLVDAGPIRVMARVDDPWIPLPTPDWPLAGKSRLVEAEGWVTDGDVEETAISMFLAGDNSQPVEIVDFVRLWTARALLPSLGLGARIAEVSEAIDTEVYANPAAALAALSSSEAPSDTIPTLMVRSGLAWANLAEAHETSAPPWTKRGALPAALLSAADSLWSDEEIDAAISVCGDAVNGLLDGQDPYASAGRLDDSAELLDQNPLLREQFIHAAGLIPQGLLSADSRVLAAMDFVAKRRDPRLEWLMRHARSVLTESERLMRMIGDPKTQKAFEARRYHSRDDGWRVVPAISMAFALAARHAARGHLEAEKWMLREQRAWAGLAEVAPQLVTIDLIIAELTVGTRLKQESGVSQ